MWEIYVNSLGKNLNVCRQGNLFSACVYTEGASLSLLEVISDIISGKGFSLITFDPTTPVS